MNEFSMWDDTASDVTSEHTARTASLAVAAVEPLWPYLREASTGAEFESRLALSDETLLRLVASVVDVDEHKRAYVAAHESLSGRFAALHRARSAAKAQQDALAGAVASVEARTALVDTLRAAVAKTASAWEQDAGGLYTVPDGTLAEVMGHPVDVTVYDGLSASDVISGRISDYDEFKVYVETTGGQKALDKERIERIDEGRDATPRDPAQIPLFASKSAAAGDNTDERQCTNQRCFAYQTRVESDHEHWTIGKDASLSVCPDCEGDTSKGCAACGGRGVKTSLRGPAVTALLGSRESLSATSAFFKKKTPEAAPAAPRDPKRMSWQELQDDYGKGDADRDTAISDALKSRNSAPGAAWDADADQAAHRKERESDTSQTRYKKGPAGAQGSLHSAGTFDVSAPEVGDLVYSRGEVATRISRVVGQYGDGWMVETNPPLHEDVSGSGTVVYYNSISNSKTEWKTGSLHTANVYCKTHDVYVGDGNSSTHTDCEKEQRKSADAAGPDSHPKDGEWWCEECGIWTSDPICSRHGQNTKTSTRERGPAITALLVEASGRSSSCKNCGGQIEQEGDNFFSGYWFHTEGGDCDNPQPSDFLASKQASAVDDFPIGTRVNGISKNYGGGTTDPDFGGTPGGNPNISSTRPISGVVTGHTSDRVQIRTDDGKTMFLPSKDLTIKRSAVQALLEAEAAYFHAPQPPQPSKAATDSTSQAQQAPYATTVTPGVPAGPAPVQTPSAKDPKVGSVRREALRVLAEVDPDALDGLVQKGDFETVTHTPVTTRPRVMPNEHANGGDPAAGGVDKPQGTALAPTIGQRVVARIQRLAGQVLADNPDLSRREATALAAKTVAQFPQMISEER